MRGAVVVVAGAERERGRGGDAWRRKGDVLKPRRAGAFRERHAEASLRAREHEGLLVGAQAFALAAPAEVFQAC